MNIDNYEFASFLNLAPTLSYFNATALEGGRSILLQWKIAFFGGSFITNFRVKVRLLALIITRAENNVHVCIVS